MAKVRTTTTRKSQRTNTKRAPRLFDKNGHPTGNGWDEMLFPDVSDAHAYALVVSGHSLEPVYRDGDSLVVSPEAMLRRGDRVILKTKDGKVAVRRFVGKSAKRLEVATLSFPRMNSEFALKDVVLCHRVIWASQ